MAPLGHERGSLASATLDGKVYAIGGGTSGVQLNTVELLDPTVNTWMLAKSLHAMRFRYCLVSPQSHPAHLQTAKLTLERQSSSSACMH